MAPYTFLAKALVENLQEERQPANINIKGSNVVLFLRNTVSEDCDVMAKSQPQKSWNWAKRSGMASICNLQAYFGHVRAFE